MKIDHEARAALEELAEQWERDDLEEGVYADQCIESLRSLLLRMESEPECDCPDCEDRTRKTGLASRMHWYDPFG